MWAIILVDVVFPSPGDRLTGGPIIPTFALRLQHTVVHCVIGLKILNELVNEMNQRTKKRSMTQHRKVATSFRDLSLLQTFEIAITLLNQVWIDCGVRGSRCWFHLAH